jgi:hypothetical protein
VEWPISLKERDQLIDLREDWGKSLVKPIWSLDKAEAPPLRLLVEVLMEAAPLADPRRAGRSTKQGDE